MIYFPVNAGHRGYRASELDQLSRLGADAYLVDYRGYGDNPGKPTEENFAADAQSAWKFVTTTRHVKPSQVVLLGESLGGGVASRLAFKAMNISVTVDDLANGKRIECKDILEMLAVEEQIRDAAQTFKQILEAASHFGGEEVIAI